MAVLFSDLDLLFTFNFLIIFLPLSGLPARKWPLFYLLRGHIFIFHPIGQHVAPSIVKFCVK